MNAFYGNPSLTPTDKAIIVEALNSLGGAGGREIFLSSAAKANSPLWPRVILTPSRSSPTMDQESRPGIAI